jgi:hypothetical protein
VSKVVQENGGQDYQTTTFACKDIKCLRESEENSIFNSKYEGIVTGYYNTPSGPIYKRKLTF